MSHLRALAEAFSTETPPPGDMRNATQDWTNACGALCNQFVVKKQGWAKAPAAYGPDAETIGDHSGPLNTNAAAAPIGAWHFWHVGTAGHVAQDLDGAGTALFMATTRAVGINLGNALRIVSVAQYNSTGGVTYRGWSTNYWGGITAYVEPAPIVVAPNQRQVVSTSGAKRRALPVKDDAGNPGINPPLPANTVTTPRGFVDGDLYQGLPWLQNEDGTYSHFSGFTDHGTHDLVNLNTVTITFDAAGGEPIPAPATVLVNTPVAEPEVDPVLPGSTFTNWADSVGHAWDFATPVAVPATLTAEYVDLPEPGCDCPSVEEIVAGVMEALQPQLDRIEKLAGRPFPTYVPQEDV